MSINFLKNDSHRMMEIMWGNTPNDNRRAYIWLSQNLGYDVHFSRSSDRDIREAHTLLFNRMMRKGFTYEKDYMVKIEKPKKVKPPKKKKEKKINIKAPNLRELQKFKTPPPIRKLSWYQKLLNTLF